jgi:hypothetical protein
MHAAIGGGPWWGTCTFHFIGVVELALLVVPDVYCVFAKCVYLLNTCRCRHAYSHDLAECLMRHPCNRIPARFDMPPTWHC